MKTRLSLLEQVGCGAEDAWSELSDLYRPLIKKWLRRYDFREQDAEDLSQEVMTVLIDEIQKFEHNGNVGAFRNWLRQITINRVKRFFRKKQKTPKAMGGSKIGDLISDLEDPKSQASVEFDREHDLYLLGRLLRLVATEFQESTMEIFRMYVVEDVDAAEVAKHFGVPTKAAYTAKSRVMRRLRELAPDLLNDLEC